MRRVRNGLVALIAAMLVSLVMVVPAFATSTSTGGSQTATNDSTAAVTVGIGTEGLANAGDTLSAYKVVSVTINTDNTLTYAFTSSFTAFQKSDDGKAYASLTADDYCAMKTDDSTFKSLLGAYSAYLMGQNPRPTADYSAEDTDNDGSVTFDKMAMGQYIIIGTGNVKGAIVYQTVTAEVVPTTKNNTYVISDTYSVSMKTTKPTGSKTLDKGFTDDTNGDTTYKTASIGDTLTYTLTGTVPTYPENATNTTYYMGDKLSSGLSMLSTADTIVVNAYKENSTVAVPLKLGTDYTVTISGQQLYIDYNYANIKQYKTLTATYNVILNDNAKVGTEEGNPNTYTLVWSNNPFNGSTTDKHPTGEGYGSTEDTKIVYTYALSIYKYEEKTETDHLAGAVFDIYDNKGCTGTPIAEVTTDENGYAAYTGLEKGTYYLKETKAPAGYKLLVEPVEIDLSAATATSSVATTKTTTYTTDQTKASIPTQAVDSKGTLLWLPENATGQDTTASATKPDGYVAAYVVSTTTTVTAAPAIGTAGTGFYAVKIPNAKGSNLPTTGGMGTTIFYIVGGILVLGALIALITKKRMANKQI